MAILQLQALSAGFGERTLFSGGSFGIEKQDKIGLIGGNGVGKTTLFRIICGLQSPTDGSIAIASDCRIGYLEQHAMPDSDESLYAAVESVFAPLKQMESELSAIAAALDSGQGDPEKLTVRQHLLTEAYQSAGGLTYKSRCRASLLGMGFTEEMLSRSVRLLSGGERTMAMLVRLLLSDANLLLLDEPTNHLDMDACAWLEDYLRTYRGAALIISHDRYFLDRVTNKTVLLTGGRFTMYEGAYTAFMQKREAEQTFARRHYQHQQQEIRRIEGIIETQKRFNRERNIRMAESKQKQIDRIKRDMETPDSEEAGIRLSLQPARESAYEVLRAEKLSRRFPDKLLFRDVTFQIYKNDRVFLLGKNGCGKTTLFSILRGAGKPDAGTVQIGPRVDVGYYDQTQADLPPQKTALEIVRDAFPKYTETRLRAALAALGLTGDTINAPVGTLSGGERAKTALTRLLLGQPNFLLLDEPTNHLDIDAKEALERALLHYGGTILAISHDRYFINKLATRILALSADGTAAYEGNYAYYLEKRAPVAALAPKPVKKDGGYQEEKARRAQKRRVENKKAKLEEMVAALEAELKEKKEQLAKSGADYEKAMALSDEIAEKEKRLEEMYEEWTLLAEET